jgi:hypothetical protein
VFVSAAVWHSGFLTYVGDKALVGIAFIIGFFPDLFISALIAKFPGFAFAASATQAKRFRRNCRWT